MEKNVRIGEPFEKFLKDNMVSIAELARDMGLKYPSLASIIKGETQRPRQRTLWALEAALNRQLNKVNKRVELATDDDGPYLKVWKSIQKEDRYDLAVTVKKKELAKGLQEAKNDAEWRKRFNIEDGEIEFAAGLQLPEDLQMVLRTTEWKELIILFKRWELDKRG